MPIPKSLHTIRVLAVMGKQQLQLDNSLTSAQAVDIAAEALGYHPSQDDYGLIAKAVKQVDESW